MDLAHPRKLDPGPASGKLGSDFTDARQLGCCDGPGSQPASKAAEQKLGALGPCPLCLARALPFLCCRTDWWSWRAQDDVCVPKVTGTEDLIRRLSLSPYRVPMAAPPRPWGGQLPNCPQEAPGEADPTDRAWALCSVSHAPAPRSPT